MCIRDRGHPGWRLHDGHTHPGRRSGGRALSRAGHRPLSRTTQRARPGAGHRGRAAGRVATMSLPSPGSRGGDTLSGEFGAKVLVIDDDASLLRALTISLTARAVSYTHLTLPTTLRVEIS